MDRYVEGFVLPVGTEKLDSYRDLAERAGKIWMKHGALEYVECVGEDLDPDTEGVPIRTFPQLADAGDDESVVFSYIVYESRDHRDEVNEKVLADPEMDPEGFEDEMPFDMERLAQGGFRTLVHDEK